MTQAALKFLSFSKSTLEFPLLQPRSLEKSMFSNAPLFLFCFVFFEEPNLEGFLDFDNYFTRTVCGCKTFNKFKT